MGRAQRGRLGLQVSITRRPKTREPASADVAAGRFLSGAGKIYSAMILKRAALACALLVFLGNPAGAAVEIYGQAFRAPSDAGYSESWSVDNGGLLTLLLRNTGYLNEQIATVRIDGADVSADSRVKWRRVWPTTLAPGEVGCVWVKSTDSSLIAQGKSITAQIVTTRGASHSLAFTCVSPQLRIGSIVPSADRKTLHIYLRNTSSSDAYSTVEAVYVNSDVTAQCTVLGAGMQPNGVAVIKVAYAQPLPLLGHLNVQVRARKTNGEVVWAAGATRVVEGWFPVGTWSSSLSSDEAGMEYARNMLIDLATMSDSNRIAQRYHIRTIQSSTDPAYIAGRAGSEALGAWMVADEPELGSTPSASISAANQTYWDNDPTHYTYLNLCTSRAFNEYGHISDIIGEDHYAMFSAPNLIPGTWVTRSAEMNEALAYCAALKRNTEPIRMWVWSQLAARGTWSTQPRDYGVDYQFWANVMAGAKGILWFKYGPGYENDSETSAQIARAVNCIRKFSQIKNLCLYADVSDSVVASTGSVKSMALVGEHAAVIVVLNNTIRTTGFPWSPGYTLDSVSGNVKLIVPDWLPIEQVSQVTESGFVVPSYGVSGREVTINFSGLQGESLVYVVGRADTVPPDSPGGLNCALYKGSDTYLLSWKEPFDAFGIRQYRVYVNGAQVGTTRAPVYNLSTADPVNATITVRAVDSTGNLSQPSLPFKIGTWIFDEDGYTENWRPVRHIASMNAFGGSLRLDVNGTNPSIESPKLVWNPDTFRFMRFRLKNPTASVWARIFWITSTDTDFNTTKSIRFPIAAFSDYTEYVVDLKTSAGYTGTITQIRLDVPDDGVLGQVEIDYIEFKPTNPDTIPPETPGAPWSASAIVAQNRITWQWNAVTDTGGSGFLGYRVLCRDSQGNMFANNWAGNVTSYNVSWLPTNRTYFAQVIAKDGAGNESESEWSSGVLVDYEAPSVPGGLSAQAVSSTEVRLTWNASSDACGVAGYRIYRGGSQVGSSPGTSFRDSGLAAGVEYSYRVSAYDVAGNESAQSAPIAVSIVESSIAGAKMLPDASNVLLSVRTVTAAFAGGFYIQEPDRSAAIFVIWPDAGAVVGKRATVAGAMTTLPSGERAVDAIEVTLSD